MYAPNSALVILRSVSFVGKILAARGMGNPVATGFSYSIGLTLNIFLKPRNVACIAAKICSPLAYHRPLTP